MLPQLGSVALQAGEHAGANIARIVGGDEPKPFQYNDKETMAAIARGAAVAQLHGGRTMKGKIAFLAWGAVHLTLLSAGRTARRRWSTGPGAASATSGPGGSS